MSKKYGKNKFFDYVNKPMTHDSVEFIYRANHIQPYKCELYRDFVVSLLMLIFTTYMGDEITNEDEKIRHFKWCWDKNIKGFKTEGLDFTNDKLFDYFIEFTLEVYYSFNDKKSINELDNVILNLWYDIFNLKKIKTESDIDTLIEIYRIFEESIKNV